jgi:hypothetical protein
MHRASALCRQTLVRSLGETLLSPVPRAGSPLPPQPSPHIGRSRLHSRHSERFYGENAVVELRPQSKVCRSVRAGVGRTRILIAWSPVHWIERALSLEITKRGSKNWWVSKVLSTGHSHFACGFHYYDVETSTEMGRRDRDRRTRYSSLEIRRFRTDPLRPYRRQTFTW